MLMVAVSFVGRLVNGKRRWLGVGSFSFQPTEFAKIALIIMLAYFITKKGDNINHLKAALKVVYLTCLLYTSSMQKKTRFSYMTRRKVST